MGRLAPGMIRFEVYTRCGKGRRYHGTVPASSSIDAAWYWFAQHPSTNRVLVRPEGSLDKCFAYKRAS